MTSGYPKNNDAYIELLKRFPPRPITSHEEFVATQKVIDSLIDKQGQLTSDEQDYLNLLGTLVYEYEIKASKNILDLFIALRTLLLNSACLS